MNKRIQIIRSTIQRLLTPENLRRLLSVGVHLSFAAFAAAMAFAVYYLGEKYQQPLFYRLVVAAGCVTGIVGHGASVTRRTTNASRTMHGIALGTWLCLSLFLASLYMLVSSSQLAKMLPPEMILIGAYVYTLAFAIGLLTSATALVIPSVSRAPISDSTHATMGGVITRYGETVIILLAIAASSFHLYLFGKNVARLDMFSTIAAMLIADLAFLVAEKRVLAEVKTRKLTGKYDLFDLVAWGTFSIAVLLYLIVINMYSVRFNAGTLNLNDAGLRTIMDFYSASPTALLSILAVLSILTAFVDKRIGEGKKGGDDGGRISAVTLAKPRPTPPQAALEQNSPVGELPAAHPRNAEMVRLKAEGGRGLKLAPGDPNNLKTPTERKCRYCGKSFYGVGRAKFCSKACRQNHHNHLEISTIANFDDVRGNFDDSRFRR